MSDKLTAIERGRRDLRAWRDALPEDYFAADQVLSQTLERLWGTSRFEREKAGLHAFGELCAQVIDPLVRDAEYRGNMPRLERFNGIGERTEAIVYDGRYNDIGRHIYGSGAMTCLGEPGNMLKTFVLLHLSNQNGESGHNCPLVCTAGVVRALINAGSDELKSRFLPGLLDNNWDTNLTGAQFLTEVQGGSDVGANATTATLVDSEKGLWRIDGEKWFCSNASADLILMTARLADGEAGTRGLGLFIVPRLLDSGEVNHFSIRRLKDKLGTRAMASGEFDFNGALGWHLGPVGDGFKTMMRNVINTSRLFNAGGVLSMARRAMVTASAYARNRGAFGSKIADYPLVQEYLAQMRSEYSALMAVSMDLVHLQDRFDTGHDSDVDRGYFRVAINLNKYRTAVSSGEIIRQSLELLGGNGAIESFSVIPRMLRDNVVYENWEGTHNTLLMQVLRDMARLGVAQPFLAGIAQRFESLAGSTLDSWVAKGTNEVTRLGGQLAELASIEPELASLHMRPLGDRMSWLMAAACLAQQAQWESQTRADDTSLRALEIFWHRRLDTPLPLATSQHLEDIAVLAQAK